MANLFSAVLPSRPQTRVCSLLQPALRTPPLQTHNGFRPVRKIAVIGDAMTSSNANFGLSFAQPSRITGVVLNQASLDCQAGVASLEWDAELRSLCWCAPGDLPGLPVPVMDGIYHLPSATPGHEMRVEVSARSLPTESCREEIASLRTPQEQRHWRRNSGFMYFADALTYQNFVWLPNFGIRDNRAADLAQRLDQVLEADPDLVITQCGGNDIVAGRVEVAQVAAQIENLWDRILVRGMQVIAILVPPRWGQEDACNYSARLQANLLALNTRLMAGARKRTGVHIVNAYPQSVDVGSNKGAVKADQTHDGVLPSGGMAQGIALQIAAILQTLTPLSRHCPNVGAAAHFHPDWYPAGNLLRLGQGAFAGEGGALGEGVNRGSRLAAGYTLDRQKGQTCCVTANKVADPDGGPEWQELVFSGAQEDEEFCLFPYALPINHIAAGELLQGELEFQLQGSGCSGLWLEVVMQGGNLPRWEALQLKDVLPGLRARGGVLALEPLVWRPGVTAALPCIGIMARPGSHFTLRLRNFSFQKV